MGPEYRQGTDGLISRYSNNHTCDCQCIECKSDREWNFSTSHTDRLKAAVMSDFYNFVEEP